MLAEGSVVADSAPEPATVAENSEKLEKAAGVKTVEDAAIEAVLPADEVALCWSVAVLSNVSVSKGLLV